MKLGSLFVIVFFLFLFSCEKNYDSNLRGRWQLRTETPANGTARNVDSIFYSFDNNVVSVQNVESSLFTHLAFGKFTQVNDSLSFDYVDWNGTHDFYLKKGIIRTRTEHYYILKLTNNTLQLKSKDRELWFRKF